MKIVFFLTYFDSQTGGMERQALQLAKNLRARGCQIFFITCAHINRMRREHLKIIDTFYGFKVYRIPLIGGWRRVNVFLYFLGGLAVLLFLKERYQIIHAHQLHTSGVIACIAKLFLPAKKLIIKNSCKSGNRGRNASFGISTYSVDSEWSGYEYFFAGDRRGEKSIARKTRSSL